ncbi:cupin domain-containing protein [Kaistia granuli]|uniref:cupin domain-containing protein n=1 Tax=Kaistia granuli TaxID=363259 RepID=UPI00037FEC09|nr:cupin domain-containing protein [Kaistia granuli]
MTDLKSNTYHLFGNLIRFHANSPDTGGAYSLVESLTAPGAGAPANRHPGEDEAFYILDGTFEFVIEGETITATSGQFLKIPDGAVHAFKNAGTAPGRLLILNTPGRLHDAFFSQAGDPLPPETRELPPPSGEAPDVSRIISIAQQHGMEFMPPAG